MHPPCLWVAAALLAVPSAAQSIPHFTEATAEAGLLWYAMTWGAAAVDVDEDGDHDLLSGHHFSSAYLHTNDGAGHFSVWDLPQIVTFTADRHGFLWADLDSDGFADAYCVHGGEGGCPKCDTDPSELWRSLGDGLFEATYQTALADSLARGRAASAADIDGDGDLDIHVSKAPLPLSPNSLFRNDGALSFVNVASQWGVDEIEGTVGSLFADVDDDGDPDLLVGGEEFSRPTFLWRNDGGHFTNATFEMFGELPVIAGADFGDFDGDRDLDLVVCEGSEGVFDAWQAAGNSMWFFANHRFGEDGVDAWTFRTPDGNPTASLSLQRLCRERIGVLGATWYSSHARHRRPDRRVRGRAILFPRRRRGHLLLARRTWRELGNPGLRAARGIRKLHRTARFFGTLHRHRRSTARAAGLVFGSHSSLSQRRWSVHRCRRVVWAHVLLESTASSVGRFRQRRRFGFASREQGNDSNRERARSFVAQ